MPPVTISSLRGGLNEEAPTSIDRDQCTALANVEFDRTTLPARRLGATPITGPGFTGPVTFLHRHLPTTDETAAQLWALSVAAGVASLRYKDTSWNSVAPVDAITVTSPYLYQMQGQTLHGKLFLAYKSGQDRLHVWDGTTLRRTGLAASAAPSVANTGAGAYSGTRYFRTRFATQSGGSTLRRSEPSTATTFSPSGAGSAARVTMPALIGEGETHWELEASTDNSNFYRIATTVVGTTTYDDSTALGTGYAVSGVLSDDVGDYDLLHSAKFVIADDDRLVLLGSHENAELASRMAWTPVYKDPGVGNDERSPIDTDNFKDLDNYEGGPITGGSRTTSGYLYIFKQSHIYQAVRRGVRQNAYEVRALTKVRGAIEGSIVEAVDQRGNSALYFLDPDVGPCRLGEGGLQRCGRDIQETWATVNVDALVPARALYDPVKRQVQWWVATAGSTTPNVRLVLQTEHQRQGDEGLRRGWTIFTGPSCAALAVCLYSENIDANTTRSKRLRPFLGISTGAIWRGDTGTDDGGTAYEAYATSAPLALGAVVNTFGLRAGSIVCDAVDDVSLEVRLIRNFGEETADAVTVDCTPAGVESPKIVPLDNLMLSGLFTVQVDLRDAATPTGSWAVHSVALVPRMEETA